MLKKPLYEETQSILRAIQRLYDSKNYFVAGLVLLFSVIVPFIKAGLLAVILWVKNPATKYRLYLFVRSVSKWAMADVFAVGIFIAFMAGNAIDNLDAKLHPGFYYFIAYCLISNLSLPVPARAAARINSEHTKSPTGVTGDQEIKYFF